MAGMVGEVLLAGILWWKFPKTVTVSTFSAGRFGMTIEKYLWGCVLSLYGRSFHSCDYIGMLMGKNKWQLEDPSVSRKLLKGIPKQTCPFLSWSVATEVWKEGTIQIWELWYAQPYWKDVSCQERKAWYVTKVKEIFLSTGDFNGWFLRKSRKMHHLILRYGNIL